MLDDLERAQEAFRGAVLKAMDEAAREIFGGKVIGAEDGDLPDLFPVLDAQLLRLSARFEHPLEEA